MRSAALVLLASCGRFDFASITTSDSSSGSDTSGDTVAASACTEGDRRIEANGHCYSQFDQLLSYPDAITACASFGAHVVTIANVEENNLVRAIANNYTWLGLDDRAEEGTFRWIDGSPFNYHSWQPGEPNDSPPGEDCTESQLGGVWNDNDCSIPHQYICEREGLPTTCTYGHARVERNGHCYWRIDTELTWSGAQAACNAEVPGATLASVPDHDTQVDIGAIYDGGEFWLGADDNDTEGTFVWANGDPFSYTAWAPGEPNGLANENCLRLTDPGWNDAFCDLTAFYVCERK